MIFLKKFLTNWRAQRGKFFNISLIFHDFSYEIFNKLAISSKKFLTNWRAQRGKFLNYIIDIL